MIRSPKKLTITNCLLIGIMMLMIPIIDIIGSIYLPASIVILFIWVILGLIFIPCVIVFTVVACYRAVCLKEYKYIVINAVAIALVVAVVALLMWVILLLVISM